jgi:N-acetylmuramoyl-L-alanine amidase
VLQQAEVPAVIVELAFMSNTADMEVLKKDETLLAAAEALQKAVLRAYDALAQE